MIDYYRNRKSRIGIVIVIIIHNYEYFVFQAINSIFCWFLITIVDNLSFLVLSVLSV